MPNQDFQNELHNLGKLSKDLREMFKLSQTRLGKLAGVSRSVIADMEQEKRFPSMLTLLKLCDVFGITPAELAAEAFHDWKITVSKAERSLMHKTLRNSFHKVVTDAAISKLRKE